MEINKSNLCFKNPVKLYEDNIKTHLDNLNYKKMSARRQNLVELMQNGRISWTIEQTEKGQFSVDVVWLGFKRTLDNFATDELAQGRLSIADIKFIVATLAEGVGLGKNLEQNFEFEDDVILYTFSNPNGSFDGNIVASFYFN